MGECLAVKLIEDSLAPLYQQVMDDIQKDISTGTYSPGDKIPSEAGLSEFYGVSRITVRRAIEELVAEGYLTKRQGKGTFVNPPKLARKIHQTSEVQSFTDTCKESGKMAGATLLKLEVVPARDAEREFLNLAEDARLIHVQRLRTADDVPIMLENNFFPLDGFEFLEHADLTNQSIFSTVEKETGRLPSDSTCSLEIVRASADVAGPLKVTAGEPLFYEHVEFYDQDGKPLLIGKQYIVGSLFVFNI